MDEFLQHLNQSISAVDVQLDFERLSNRFSKSKDIPAFEKVVLSEIGGFLDAHGGFPRHKEYMISTIWAVLSKRERNLHQADLIELLFRVLGSCRAEYDFLCDLSKDGEDLLRMIYDEDTFVRFHVLRIIKEALVHDNGRLVGAFLRSPEILADIVDLSRQTNPSEFLRNEALTLLVQISSNANAELASILAYQGIGECIFDILMESEDGVSDNEVSDQAIQCLRNLCNHLQCSRYIRESGGCSQLGEFFEYALRPIIDHAQGLASEEDPEALQKRIDAGWKQCDKMLVIADILMADMEQAVMKTQFLTSRAVATMATAAESLYLTAQARASCYMFIAHVLEGNTEATEIVLKKEGLFWNIFQQMMAERTPLIVRSAIDLIVKAVCTCSPEAQHSLISQIALSSGEEEEEDQSPGRTVRAVLLHACENVKCRVPDTWPLAEQVWFSLRTLSHIFKDNLEVMRAASVLRVKSEEPSLTLSEMVVKLARNPSLPLGESITDKLVVKYEVVSTASFRLLTEWTVAVPSIADLIARDIDLLKVLVDAADMGEPVYAGVSAGLVCVLLAVAKDKASIIEPMASRIGYSRLDNLFSSLKIMESSTQGKKSLFTLPRRVQRLVSMKPVASLPTVCDGYSSFLESISSLVRLALLDRLLGPPKVSAEEDREQFARQQEGRIKELEEELETARKGAIDLKILINGSTEAIIAENEKLNALISQLKREILTNESEIQRISVMKETETCTLKAVLEELQTQVHALSESNAQLAELHSHPEIP